MYLFCASRFRYTIFVGWNNVSFRVFYRFVFCCVHSNQSCHVCNIICQMSCRCGMSILWCVLYFYTIELYDFVPSRDERMCHDMDVISSIIYQMSCRCGMSILWCVLYFYTYIFIFKYTAKQIIVALISHVILNEWIIITQLLYNLLS